MATKITYLQIEIGPSTDSLDNSIVLQNIDTDRVYIAGVDFVGGGTDKRFILDVVVCEPVK